MQSLLGRDVHLERAVVWAGEKVPDGFEASGGVYAAGRFVDCGSNLTTAGPNP